MTKYPMTKKVQGLPLEALGFIRINPEASPRNRPANRHGSFDINASSFIRHWLFRHSSFDFLLHGHFDKHEYNHGDEHHQPAMPTHVTLKIIRYLLSRRQSFFCDWGDGGCPDVYRRRPLLTGLNDAGRTNVGGRRAAR